MVKPTWKHIVTYFGFAKSASSKWWDVTMDVCFNTLNKTGIEDSHQVSFNYGKKYKYRSLWPLW